METRIKNLQLDQLEEIEKVALRVLWVAVRDFCSDAWEFFRQSDDDPKDIAEDITRELLDRMGGHSITQRIYGNVDYRKARYMILSDIAVRQALLVDSKAEKSANSATLQMSQLSMAVRQLRGGGSTDVPGQVPKIQSYGGHEYLSTTLLTHFHYGAGQGNDGKDRPPYKLLRITVAAIPNGFLQELYNPDESSTIWIAGRNAPSREEAFRVRLSFNRLSEKKSWRVQTFQFGDNGTPTFSWKE
jgi:hypothetical protein